MDITVALISAGTGLVTGILGSVAAPWANWGTERMRLRQAARAKRIKEWRAGVADLRSQLDECTRLLSAGKVYGPLPVAEEQTWYVTLRPELAADAIDQIEDVGVDPARPWANDVPTLLDREIARIERYKWKLV